MTQETKCLCWNCQNKWTEEKSAIVTLIHCPSCHSNSIQFDRKEEKEWEPLANLIAN